jgi:hypothetical protein
MKIRADNCVLDRVRNGIGHDRAHVLAATHPGCPCRPAGSGFSGPFPLRLRVSTRQGTPGRAGERCPISASLHPKRPVWTLAFEVVRAVRTELSVSYHSGRAPRAELPLDVAHPSINIDRLCRRSISSFLDYCQHFIRSVTSTTKTQHPGGWAAECSAVPEGEGGLTPHQHGTGRRCVRRRPSAGQQRRTGTSSGEPRRGDPCSTQSTGGRRA